MITAHTHTTRPGAATYQDLLAELAQSMAELQALREQAIEALAPTVQKLVLSGSRDVQRIEHALDQLVDLACLPEGLALFKTLCRHYWTLNPQATASYVNAYREQWDADTRNDADEVQP
jgi:predicted amidohydrolase YtcJ